MLRAKLHLHPHPPINTQQKSTSRIPGAFPTLQSSSSGSNGSSNTDNYSRTITLTAEFPTQPIGRSSRNKAKGLFADKCNGFFDSAVMSREHAEVRLVLDPVKKIVIRDTKSMHGTFVNGLQLKADETAELQQGTEVTFGSEVARGEDIFPPKTFRCEVEWEEVPPLKPRYTVDSGRTTGYGVTSEALLMSDDDEEDYEEDQYDDEMTYGEIHTSDHDRRSSSSFTESSPPTSANISPANKETKTAFVETSTSKNPYMLDSDIPVSHERSTKDLTVQSLTKNEFEQRLESFKKQITDQMQKSKEDPKNQVDLVDLEVDEHQARPRLTIGSLMNKSQESNGSPTSDAKTNTEKKKTKNNFDDLFFEDDDASAGEDDNDVEIIPRPANFNSRSSKKAAGDHATVSRHVKFEQPAIVIEDDDETNMHENAANGENEDNKQSHETSLFGRFFPQLNTAKETPVSCSISCSNEKDSNRNKMVEADEITQIPEPHSESPEIMSSKIPVPFNSSLAKTELVSGFEQLAKAADSIRKSPTPVAPANSLPPLPIPPTIATRTACGASHIHWLPDKPLPDYAHSPQVFCSFNDNSTLALPLPYGGNMDQKKEFFAAREHNSAMFDQQRCQDTANDNLVSIASSANPPQHPYSSIAWATKRFETPRDSGAGLFPKVKPLPDKDQGEKASSAKINKTRDASSQPLSSPAKPRVEESVPESDKVKDIHYKEVWDDENEDEGAEIDDNVDSMWDDGLNDEDGEYDEEDGNEELEMEIDNEYTEEEEEEEEEEEDEDEDEEEENEEAEAMDLHTDEIRTDMSDYGSNGTSIERTHDEHPFPPPPYHFNSSSSTVVTGSPVPLVRTTISEADKGDFTKSRGFSISNLVHENAGPQTDQLPQAATNYIYFDGNDGSRPGPSRPLWRPYGSNLIPFAGVKDNSVTDLLNPSPTGNKRKFEDISTTTEKEEELKAIKDFVSESYPPGATEVGIEQHNTEEERQQESLQDAQCVSEQLPMTPISEESQSSDTIAFESSEATITTANPDAAPATEEVAQGESEDADGEDERPRKRARKNGPTGVFARYAATALAGAVFGGVGVFAALVATAPAS